MLSYPSSLQSHSDFPYAHNTCLAGFIRLDKCLPQAESHGDAGISGPTSVISHRMPLALPRVPCRCLCPFLPCKLWPSPCKQRIGVYPRFAGFIPHPDSPSNNRPGSVYVAAPFALCYGLRLWPAPLTGCDPFLDEPSQDRVGASSAHVLPHEPALCLHIHKGN